MSKAICFDMDGTIADLYAVENWLPKLRAYDPAPYRDAALMWDATALKNALAALRNAGWQIIIITWLSKETDEPYKEAVRKAKREWLAAYDIQYDHFHGVAYGATKADSVRHYIEHGVLVDDNAAVRNGWHLGPTIDPTAVDLIAELMKLVEA